MPKGAAFFLFRKRKGSKRMIPGELRTGIGYSNSLVILCTIYTVGKEAEKLRGRKGIVDF
jgi:hypothetical protein